MNITLIAAIAPPILLALTCHEYAHGYVAYKLGDDTAYRAGRLTLNPLSHLDPIGTLMLFIIHIGWAKPVPVDPRNFKDPRRDLIWVSIAGPAANMILAFIFGMVLRVFGEHWTIFGPAIGRFIYIMLVYSVMINLVLAVFNLIPLPPLDGSKILGGLLKGEAAYKFAQLERWGPLIFLVVIAGGYYLNIPVIWWIISPFVKFFSILFVGKDLSAL